LNTPRIDTFARTVLAAGTWAEAQAIDHITLDYEGRHRRRFRYVADAGTDFVLDLAQTTLLHDGDGLQLDDGRIVRVVAAPESLVAVTAADGLALLRLAWHIGNRHLPAQLSAERILLRDDAVIVAMLRGLGAQVEPIVAAFTPERGAYAHGSAAHGDAAHGHKSAQHPFVFVAGQSHDH
jgi:urease accessory protein